jgi:hypothetical protein
MAACYDLPLVDQLAVVEARRAGGAAPVAGDGHFGGSVSA